jgi:hypothetical protein
MEQTQSKVIGFKGTEDERFDQWHRLLHFRGGKEAFSRPESDWELDRLVRDTKNYATILESYIA